MWKDCHTFKSGVFCIIFFLNGKITEVNCIDLMNCIPINQVVEKKNEKTFQWVQERVSGESNQDIQIEQKSIENFKK